MEIFLPCLYAVIACFAFASIFNINPDGAVLCSLGAALSWLIYLLSAPLFNHNEFLQYFTSAVVLSIYSEIMARVRKCPTTSYMFVAILPLVPGAMIYNAMIFAINGQVSEFLSNALHTLAIAGSLAVGVAVVPSLVRIHRTFKQSNI